jgi:hypothetical protein
MERMHPEASSLLSRLDLAAHPEGGFYRETWRSPQRVATARGDRSALTVIHFLLPARAFSAFHRIPCDEVWQHAGGDALEIHVVDPTGGHAAHVVGPGGAPHIVVPAGSWQSARPLGEAYSLACCVVAPGFEFAELEMARADDLLRLRPDLAWLVRAFTRA